MSRNKEIKFAKWWEENILDEYREIKENYFLDDNYEHYLEELEYEIKSYLRKYKHWNYSDEEIQYLFDFSDFCQAEEDEENEIEIDIVKEIEY